MQQRAIETRERILDSATALFAKKGLNGATVDEIAAHAKVNKQRIYAYFGSKNQLFEAVLLHVFENVELFSRTTLKEADENPEQLTAVLVRGFLKVHAKHPVLWRLLAWANLEGPDCTNMLNCVRKKENEELRKLFTRQIKAGVFRKISFETWLFTLLAVSCFRYSNQLTLVHTLGWNPADQSFEEQLAAELDALLKNSN